MFCEFFDRQALVFGDLSNLLGGIKMPYFVVVGRVDGDDDDMPYVYDTDSRQGAIDLFKAEKAEEQGKGFDPDLTPIYVNAVLVSDSPIVEAV